MADPNCLLAALAVIERDGRILLVQESAAPCRGKWSLPGGRLLPGEPVPAAAVREIREETGLSAELTGLLYVDQLAPSGSGGGGRIRFVFTGKAVAGDLKQTEDEHSMRAGWFADGEIRGLEARSPFLQRVVGVYRGGSAPLPIEHLHVLTPEEISRERP
jgi:ADP-ribose pyrophosphatase YjhB (NUDIX family)